jgi:hypothetical protein
MRVLISYVQRAHLREYEKTYVPMFSDELRRYGRDADLVLEEDPAKADIIILWEGFEYKRPEYIRILENDPLIRAHAERVYTVNYDDHPEGLLAGIYTSLEGTLFNSALHRIWPFFLMNNPRVYDLTSEDVIPLNPKFLFSFTGAASHEVRKRLFSLYASPSPKYCVEHVRKWYNHGDDDRLKFAQVALNSVFCLCPHGFCAYTPRITEVMAMARVPVIIADDWIPISFEENVPYYIKVAEKDIEHLGDILSLRLGDAEEYRLNARMLWEKYCSPSRRASAVVRCIANLAKHIGNRMSYDDYREIWNSKAFLKRLGWTPAQRIALRVEQHARRLHPAIKVPGVTPLMRYRNAAFR